LARKWAKSRTRGRKLHLTGVKMRVGRARKSRSDLEQELRACKREIAHVRERLVQATKQQTATSKMLRIISSSPIQSVLDAVAENAARLCDANNAEIFRLEDNLLRLAASYGEIPVVIHAYQGVPVNRDTVTGRAACDRRTIHVHDLAAEESEYPVGSSNAKREGHRTTLATPLLREGTPVGIILVRRMEVRPFSDEQIALIESFADQAVIAIENERLYNDLREREARIRRLVDSNIIGIMIGDSRGRILEANEALLDMLGYSREDLIAGRLRWTKLTPSEWAPADQDALAQLSATGTCRPYEKEYSRRDGNRVPVLVGGAFFEPKRDEGVVFVIDMTERKRAEEAFLKVQMQLAHANRVATTGQLSASIAHEVNQPITAAVTYALAARRFLSAQPPNLHEVDDALSLIVKEGNRAGEVVDRISALIKKAPARKGPVEINDAILEIISLTRTEVANNSVLVRTQLAESLPSVQGDRVQLQQVLLNLIINAIEAMRDVGEKERELLISTRNEPDGVSVEVRDSGPGFAPAALDRVFDAFYTTKPGGLGLGLSICRSIIEAHNGRLWANPNVPRGASFQFALPVIANTASCCCTREPS
jgi:PAS domain S-box-containing protein